MEYKLTEFENKVLEVLEQSAYISSTYVQDEVDYATFIDLLRKIMPPTCTPNERKFLNRLNKDFYYNEVENGITNKGNEYDILYQDTFPDINLKELVDE